MDICHVTPHLPPDQAANALLPVHLGRWAVAAGDRVTYIAHPPRMEEASPHPVSRGEHGALPGTVTWVDRPVKANGWRRLFRLDSVASSATISRRARPTLVEADIVHLHSNGLLTETCAIWARVHHRPRVLTLYGTEIWHYRRALEPFPRADLFTRMYREATHVTFYSRGLHDKAREVGLTRKGMHVVYPPVVEAFVPCTPEERSALRARLGLRARYVLLNVKRLHPLAGQRYLIEAMPDVLRQHPDTQLVICGTGALAEDLRALAAARGVAASVTFAGLVPNATIADYNRAADLFVLPSLLEALPTVAVEALACGTPVVSADHPGGVELQGLFGDDVAVVPREEVGALARAIVAGLEARRRTTPATMEVLTREFRPAAVAARFQAIYDRVIHGE